MSNLETEPDELVCDERAGAGTAQDNGVFELLEPREVPLGGPRAMTVRRTLPQRARSLIGAWCFVDHYGPDDVTDRQDVGFQGALLQFEGGRGWMGGLMVPGTSGNPLNHRQVWHCSYVGPHACQEGSGYHQ